jgi:hypothetical protein
METSEHIAAGNKIESSDFGDNPYLTGGNIIPNADPIEVAPIKITPMRFNEEGFPVPMAEFKDAKLSAGEVAALCGDYFTEAGWGKKLRLPAEKAASYNHYKEIMGAHVTNIEQRAFIKSYQQFANVKTTRKKVQAIEAISQSNLLDEAGKQVAYEEVVPGYIKRLKENVAHFTPWSTRAYMVGHQTALHYAEAASQLKLLSDNETIVESTLLPEVKTIQEDFSSANKKEKLGRADYLELSYRYHALAVGMELGTLHYYSDHFAGGHLGRLGYLRTALPQSYGGFFGGLLVNAMHGEDNHFGVNVTNDDSIGSFRNPEGETLAQGDKSYNCNSNQINRAHLINGMTSSLADINSVVRGEPVPRTNAYGGAGFLPHIDSKKPQNQPLFILTKRGDIYYRKSLSSVSKLTADEFTLRENNPNRFPKEYKKLNGRLAYFRVISLVLKIHLLSKIPLLGRLFIPTLKDPLPQHATTSHRKITASLGSERITSPEVNASPNLRVKASHEKANPTIQIFEEEDDVPSLQAMGNK